MDACNVVERTGSNVGGIIYACFLFLYSSFPATIVITQSLAFDANTSAV